VKYVEVSKFGGPEVLAVAEKETPKPEEGVPLVEVQAVESLTKLILVTTIAFKGSVPRGDRPKIKKVHPLVVVGRQRFLQKTDRLAHRLVRSGIEVTAFDL
jgi:hypothetical protein